MAEILIQWKGHPRLPDLPKRGDIRCFGPNDHTWGFEEDYRRWLADGRPPFLFDPEDPATVGGFPLNYAIVRVVGVTVPELNQMYRRGPRGCRPAESGDPGFDTWTPDPRFPIGGQTPNPVRLHKFRWRINVSELLPPKRRDLQDARFTIISEDAFVDASEERMVHRRFDKTDPDGEGTLRLPGSG